LKQLPYFLIKPEQTVEIIQDYLIEHLRPHITETTSSGSETRTEGTSTSSTPYKERLSEFTFHQIIDEHEFTTTTTTASLSSSPSSPSMMELESVERVDINESDVSASPSQSFFAEKSTEFTQTSSKKSETNADGMFLHF
jgi:uncharacterized protein (DUF3084 family)